MDDNNFINLANQCIESIDIIDDTKSIETLKSRIYLLKERFNQIYPVFQNNRKKYIVLISRAYEFHIKLWKKSSEVHPLHIYLLADPDIEKIDKFIARNIHDSFERFYYSKKDEINKLKTAKSIQKRKDEIIKIGYDFQYLYKFLEIEDDNDYKSKIENFRKQFYYKKPTI